MRDRMVGSICAGRVVLVIVSVVMVVGVKMLARGYWPGVASSMLPLHSDRVLGKIAGGVHRAVRRRAIDGAPGRATATRLATGAEWSVDDVICTSGPADRPFEEQHSGISIAVVAAGTFDYRSPAGRAFMAPGSLLLGNDGACFE